MSRFGFFELRIFQCRGHVDRVCVKYSILSSAMHEPRVLHGFLDRRGSLFLFISMPGCTLHGTRCAEQKLQLQLQLQRHIDVSNFALVLSYLHSLAYFPRFFFSFLGMILVLLLL